MSVLNFLEQLEKKLRLSEDEKGSIETSIFTLTTRLKSYFGDEISDILVFGSYKRNTNLRRRADDSSDVDIMVVFKDASYKPQTYIDKLKRFMTQKYFASEIYQGYPCAILELHHIKFELTPAIWYYNKKYKIPNNASNYEDWIISEPFYLDEVSLQKQTLRYKQIIRLVKYWNCLNYKHFASYQLEEKVLNTFLYSSSLQHNLFQVLKSIVIYDEPQYVKNYVQKTKEIIRFIEDNEQDLPSVCESKIKMLFKEFA